MELTTPCRRVCILYLLSLLLSTWLQLPGAAQRSTTLSTPTSLIIPLQLKLLRDYTFEKVKLFVHVEQLESTPGPIASFLSETIIDVPLVFGCTTHYLMPSRSQNQGQSSVLRLVRDHYQSSLTLACSTYIVFYGATPDCHCTTTNLCCGRYMLTTVPTTAHSLVLSRNTMCEQKLLFIIDKFRAVKHCTSFQ